MVTKLQYPARVGCHLAVLYICEEKKHKPAFIVLSFLLSPSYLSPPSLFLSWSFRLSIPVSYFVFHARSRPGTE